MPEEGLDCAQASYIDGLCFNLVVCNLVVVMMSQYHWVHAAEPLLPFEAGLQLACLCSPTSSGPQGRQSYNFSPLLAL